jgi:hypothetical protein
MLTRADMMKKSYKLPGRSNGEAKLSNLLRFYGERGHRHRQASGHNYPRGRTTHLYALSRAVLLSPRLALALPVSISYC